MEKEETTEANKIKSKKLKKLEGFTIGKKTYFVNYKMRLFEQADNLKNIPFESVKACKLVDCIDEFSANFIWK